MKYFPLDVTLPARRATSKVLFLPFSRKGTIIDIKQSFCLFRCLKKMDGLEISEMRVEPCVDSRFIHPSRVVFKQVTYVCNFKTFGKTACHIKRFGTCLFKAPCKS